MAEFVSSPVIDPAHAARMFPTLSPAQIARVAAHGRRRPTRAGERLIEVGKSARFFLVTAGRLEVIRPSKIADTMVVAHGPGSFTGEANMLLGRRSLMRISVTEPGEVLELTRDQLLDLIQTDTEIGEVLMRAFL